MDGGVASGLHTSRTRLRGSFTFEVQVADLRHFTSLRDPNQARRREPVEGSALGSGERDGIRDAVSIDANEVPAPLEWGPVWSRVHVHERCRVRRPEKARWPRRVRVQPRADQRHLGCMLIDDEPAPLGDVAFVTPQHGSKGERRAIGRPGSTAQIGPCRSLWQRNSARDHPVVGARDPHALLTVYEVDERDYGSHRTPRVSEMLRAREREDSIAFDVVEHPSTSDAGSSGQPLEENEASIRGVLGAEDRAARVCHHHSPLDDAGVVESQEFECGLFRIGVVQRDSEHAFGGRPRRPKRSSFREGDRSIVAEVCRVQPPHGVTEVLHDGVREPSAIGDHLSVRLVARITRVRFVAAREQENREGEPHAGQHRPLAIARQRCLINHEAIDRFTPTEVVPGDHGVNHAIAMAVCLKPSSFKFLRIRRHESSPDSQHRVRN